MQQRIRMFGEQMRYFVAATVMVVACAWHAASAEPVVMDKAVIAFRDICIATVPTFEKAMDVARDHGVKPQKDPGASLVGMAKDRSFAVQVRVGKECAISAEANPDTSLTRQFLEMVASAAGISAKSLDPGQPMIVLLSGKTYAIRNDRRGGEVYVITNISGL